MSELIFDKYEVVNRLAVGGMGEVFYAVQKGGVKGFERPVILKNLLPELAQQEGFIEQFLDEARVAATLNHPNVVSIYEVGSWNGVYFIAMEFIRGLNVSQLIRASLKAELPIPPAVIARVVHDAALGLDHAHTAKDAQGRALNIVHRDISPQNIMVRDDGVTKVVDFGIARAANRTARTATGALKGKLAYMAPEQVASRQIDSQADQFALGIVLWEMCTRRRLFQAERDVDLIQKVLQTEIVAPSSLVPGLPDELDQIALRMLHRDPKRRFASLAQVARELEAFLVKVSRPSSESPVAAYLQKLGVDDAMSLALKSSPAGHENFVISLRERSASTSSPGFATRATVLTTLGRAPRHRGLGMLVLAFLLMAAAGGGVSFVLLRHRELPVAAAAAQAAAAAAAERVPRLGRLRIVSVPSGATLRLNGRKLGETPQWVELPCGEANHVQLDKPGYEMLEREVVSEEGHELTVELTLMKVESEAEPRASSSSKARPVPSPRR